MEWMDFKKSFTQAQEDALWQYFIDHSQVQGNGYLGVMFYVRDVNDFWKRVHARANGDFHRYEKIDKETVQLSRDKIMRELRHCRWRSKQISDVCFTIDEHGSVVDKVVLGLYRWTRRYLIG